MRACTSRTRATSKCREEALALAPGLCRVLAEAALAGARALRYENLGTMEFLVGEDGAFHFLEMNPHCRSSTP